MHTSNLENLIVEWDSFNEFVLATAMIEQEMVWTETGIEYAPI